MANTRDTLGDQATLDGLVNHTLTSLEENGVTELRQYALYNNTALTSIKFPNLTTGGRYSVSGCTGLTEIATTDFPSLTSVGSYMFANCTNLTEAEFPAVNSVETYAFQYDSKLETIKLMGTGTKTISSNAFNGCSKLRHLIINSSSISTLFNVNAFTGTSINLLDGAVYVPSNLISTYKANTSWKNFIIADIEDYPLSSFETITDSWSTITSNSNYSTDYSIGDTKNITINGVQYAAQIIGFDLDVKANGTGTAPITWMLVKLFETHNMNTTSTTTGGWEGSGMRTHLINDILPNIDIKNYIIPVTKTYYDYDSTSTKSCTDSIFIPSHREIFGGTSYEDSGCVYTKFNSASSARIKYYNGSAYSWWLRSANRSGAFRYVSGTGYENSNNATYTLGGVALCFCT